MLSPNYVFLKLHIYHNNTLVAMFITFRIIRVESTYGKFDILLTTDVSLLTLIHIKSFILQILTYISKSNVNHS